MRVAIALAIALTMSFVDETTAGHAVPVSDGSFELGPPPNSAWTEGSTTNCEWIVDAATIASVFGAATVPHDGNWVYWAGGYCNFVVSSIDSVSQDVAVPSNATDISFWYQLHRGDPDEQSEIDVAYVSINDSPIWMLPMSQANVTGPVWNNMIVDVTAFAGQVVDLTFGGVSVGLTGNCLFDDIEWLTLVVPVENQTWGAIKALYREE